ncbi:hypothetical protein PLESTB_001211100 [Pleodorina starrii]|uniref:Uncharacterized protein n=1 Tax=Pleodorina starrii TaxID=330485 RepID=A0A9W6BSB5_9CHLO|nr:hypothetical protein PLESTB_001211100 [Pleodorina starrii]GLC71284.1 hypothetical protein PLESTF_001098900 [Pleodorina starrii]
MENGHHEDERDGDAQAPTEQEYAWLREQLAAAARLGGAEDADDAEDDGWEDPTGGPLRELFTACEEGDAERVKELLQGFSGDVNTPGPDGDTALHLACLFGHARCVEALLDGGADANTVNPEDRSTALHDAAAGGYVEICEMVLAKANGAIVSKADGDGDTPLHNAARGNHADVVKLLLSRGANANVQNGYGNKPVDEAEEQPLPQHGVGSLVTRDTWHPESGKFWKVVEVVPLPSDPTKLSVWGHQYWKGKLLNPAPKRIASVWKHGWMLKSPTPLQLELAARREAAAAVCPPKQQQQGTAAAP